ncbi:MAG: ABC transporter permease [Planctomycetota bacterium]|nr:ABC transporter permease [Planctomycetota bacterium]
MNLWAIARNTVLEAFRMRVLAFAGAFVLLGFPIIVASLKSYGSPKAELQVVLTYSLELVNIILCLLTVFLATWTLCTEIQDRQIFSLDTKPVYRWQILGGKFLGIVIVNLILLIGMAAPTYGLICWQLRKLSQEERTEIENKLLYGRRSVLPTAIDLNAAFEKEMRRRIAEGLLTGDTPLARVQEEVRNLVWQRSQTVQYGYTKAWEFRGLPDKQDIPEGKSLIVRFKIFTPNPTLKVQKTGSWRFKLQDGDLVGQTRLKATTGVTQEISLHRNSMRKKGGKFYVEYKNVDRSRTLIIFPINDGIEILYPTLPFTQNFINGCCLILIRVSFLAILGLACSTFLTFPMAITVTLVTWVLCMISNYMIEISGLMLMYNINEQRIAEGPDWLDESLRMYIRLLFSAVPDFTTYNPVPLLTDGREVSYSMVGKAFFSLVLLRGGVVALVSGIIFQMRELAKLAR